VDFPNFWIFSITSSNLEYETEHRLGSIKSFTLSPKGDDRWLINLQPPLLLGTTPTGLRRKFDIGYSVKGPAILPKSISLLIFSSIAFSCFVAERKCFA
jgi:hypothetical protein